MKKEYMKPSMTAMPQGQMTDMLMLMVGHKGV